MSGLGGMKLVTTFGQPTLRAYYEVAGHVRLKCEVCGAMCPLALDGRKLHSPSRRPRPNDKSKFECRLHTDFCTGRR